MDAPPHETRRLALLNPYSALHTSGCGFVLSHVLVFFFAMLLENYGTIVVDIHCFYCTTEKKKFVTVARKMGRKKRRGGYPRNRQKELLTFINVGTRPLGSWQLLIGFFLALLLEWKVWRRGRIREIGHILSTTWFCFTFVLFRLQSFPTVVSVLVARYAAQRRSAPDLFIGVNDDGGQNKTEEKQDATKWFRRFSIFKRECWKCFNHKQKKKQNKQNKQTKEKSDPFHSFVCLFYFFFYSFEKEKKREYWTTSGIYRKSS